MGLSERAVLHAYFVAAASIFEPERAAERLAWARTAALIEVFRSHIRNSSELKQTVLDFVNKRSGSSKVTNGLTRALQHSLRLQAWEVLLAHGRDVRHHIRQAWEQWLRGWQGEDEDAPRDAELLVRTINLCAGRPITDDISSCPTYHYLNSRTSQVCSKLRKLRETKVQVYNGEPTVGRRLTQQDHCQPIDDKMQEIAQGVLCRTDDLALDTKLTFLTIAKGFYYVAHCSPANLNQHIAKVLFERVP